MTNEEIIAAKDAELARYSPEERALYLVEERNYDIKKCARLSSELNADITIVEDNRHVISVDGVVMGYNEWEEWYNARRTAMCNSSVASTPSSRPSSRRRTGLGFFGSSLPTTTVIPSSANVGTSTKAIKDYLRRTYGYCLAKGTNPTATVDERTGSVSVTNIQWGRKLSPAELAR